VGEKRKKNRSLHLIFFERTNLWLLNLHIPSLGSPAAKHERYAAPPEKKEPYSSLHPASTCWTMG